MIKDPNIPLEAYVKPLLSPSFDWIVHLSLSNVASSLFNWASSRAEIASLSRLVNLGAMTIDGSPTGTSLDDGIIRAWARAATESGAFSMLRVLILKAQKEITSQSFAYLSQFPSLALVNTENCLLDVRSMAEATGLGWRYRTGRDLTDFLNEKGPTGVSWDAVVRALFRQAGAYDADHLDQQSVEAIDSLPVLHFCLGRPSAPTPWDFLANERMMCYQRICLKSPPSHSATVDMALCDEQKSKNVPAKRPKVRNSKLESFGDLLVGFGP